MFFSFQKEDAYAPKSLNLVKKSIHQLCCIHQLCGLVFINFVDWFLIVEVSHNGKTDETLVVFEISRQSCEDSLSKKIV